MNNVIDQLHTLLSASMSDLITSFYKGEVVLPPKSYLPALMIIPNSTNVIAKSTAKDQFVYSITIRVVADIKQYLKEGGTSDTIKSTEALVNFMEERESDGSLKDATVLGTLRNNIRTADFIFNNDIEIEYKTVERGEWFYIQAELNLTATTDLISR